MICPKCDEEVILSGTKFCPNCGSKLETPAISPNIKEIFTGVREISLGVGNRVNINPSSTPETTITIDAPEEIKRQLKIEFSGGVLSVSLPSAKIRGVNIINNRGISIGGVSCSSVVIRNGSVTVNGQRIVSSGDNGDVVINISTPVGVDVDINTAGGLQCSIGDLRSKISLDTSGGCVFKAICISDFDADTSGGLTAIIDSFAGGRCNLDTSGSCQLSVLSGNIEKLTVDASGTTTLNVTAKTEKAILDVSGILSGTLHADVVRKDVSGVDTLTIVR